MSGFRGQQFTEGALGRFVEMVRSGSIRSDSYLLIEDLDRFSRENPLTATGRLFDLVNMGITVVTVSDGLEYSKDSLTNDVGRLVMLVLQLSRSHLESARKSDMVGKAWAKKKAAARRGEHKVSRRCPEWLKLVDGAFVENENRFDIVRGIFRDTIAGMGRGLIAQRLNEKGVLPFKHGQMRKEGRPPPAGWHASSVAKILYNRAVLGEYQPGKGSHKSGNYGPDGDPIPDYYPRIISDEIFYLAHAAIESRRQGSAGRRGGKGAHILRNLCRCGSCGGSMHVKNKGEGPKGGISFVCSAAHRKAGCSMSRRWKVARVERAALRAFAFVEPAALSSVDEGLPKAEALVLSLKAQLAEEDALRKRLLHAVTLTKDEDAIEMFEAQVAKVRSLKAALKKAESDASVLRADPGIASRLVDAVSMSKRLDKAEGEEREDLIIRLNEVLKTLVDRVEFVSEQGAVLVFKPWLQQKRLGSEVSDTIVPYAVHARAEAGQLVTRILIEDEATDAQIDAFLGLSLGSFRNERASKG